MGNQETMEVTRIGTIQKKGESRQLVLDKKYRPHCTRLDLFSHVHVIWWAEKYLDYREQMDSVIDLPYAPGNKAGLFATRSPIRPNPVCSTVCRVIDVNIETGVINIDEIDAFDGTAVLDIKPYYASNDRVEAVTEPSWAKDWPKWRVPIPEENYEE